VSGLDWVKATHQTLYGPLSVDWEKHGPKLSLKVTVPANTTATVFVPSEKSGKVLVEGKPAAKMAGIRFLRAEPGTQVFEVGSGMYEFSSTL
jgi:alpha-L-rhamnosidase